MISMAEDTRKRVLKIVGTVFVLTLVALALFIGSWASPTDRVQAAVVSEASSLTLYMDSADDTAVSMSSNALVDKMAQPFATLRLYVAQPFWEAHEDSS